jgi:hypothetical protein
VHVFLNFVLIFGLFSLCIYTLSLFLRKTSAPLCKQSLQSESRLCCKLGDETERNINILVNVTRTARDIEMHDCISGEKKDHTKLW